MNILKKIRAFFSSINSKTLHGKYLSWFFFSVFIPILLSLIIGAVFWFASIHSENEKMAIQTMTSLKAIVSDTLSSIEDYSYAILTDESVDIAIKTDDVVKNADDINNVRKMLNHFVKQNKYIKAAEIFSMKSNYLFGTMGSSYLDSLSEDHLEWYRYYKETGMTDFYLPIKMNGVYKLCLVRSLQMNKSVVAFIIVYVDMERVYLFEDDTSEYMLIYSDDDTVIYSTEANYIGEPISQTNSNISSFYKKSHNVKKGFNQTWIKEELLNSRMSLVLYQKNSSYLLVLFAIVLLLVTALAYVISVLLSVALTDAFYSHISKIISYITSNYSIMNNYLIDNPTTVKKSLYNSILHLRRGFEKELSDIILNLKKSQIAALQMQFNPHFLFNALNYVNMKSYEMFDVDNEVSEIISLVSELLATSLDTQEVFVSVSDELNYLKKYIRIESIKYDYNFDVYYDIDNLSEQCKTVKFSLQPLVENAFKHGIHQLPKDVRGKLIVEIKVVDNTLVFKIYDNGNPKTETLERINAELSSHMDNFELSKKHIGLKNVNERIRILYGKEYGCRIYRENNMTVSEIIIQKQDI